jgi:hypothetical protein
MSHLWSELFRFLFLSKSYRLCRNMAFIERCSEEDEAVSFRVDWIKFLAQAMLGFCHFGLAWGRRSRDGRFGIREDDEMSNCRDSQKWGIYTVPMPRERRGYQLESLTSCFIVLQMFLVAPKVTRFPAFNQKAHPWKNQLVPRGYGYLKITHCSDTTVLDVWYMCARSQTDLLSRYVIQQQRLQLPIPHIVVLPARAWQEKVKLTGVAVRTPAPFL